jgi:hypothetical protein
MPMCNVAKKLFEQYSSAVSRAAVRGNHESEQRILNTRGLLANHNQLHGCCAVIHFETSTADAGWKFHLVSPQG